MPRVPERVVAEFREVEVGVERPVQVRQQVEVELGGEAGLVVVGARDQSGCLDQVDADQQAAVAAGARAQSRQQPQRRVALEVADGRAREEVDDARGPAAGRQRQREFRIEVGDDRHHLERRVRRRQSGRRLHQEVARDVDRHVARQRRQRIQQQPRLGARAAARLDQQRALADRGGDRADVLAQDRRLDPRQVVLGLLADPLEQPRALCVVQVARRDVLRRVAQPGEQFMQLRLRGPRLRVVAGEGGCARGARRAARGEAGGKLAWRSRAGVHRVSRPSPGAGPRTASAPRAGRSCDRSRASMPPASRRSRRAAPPART